MKKLIEFLNKVFAPRVTTTYHYNGKQVQGKTKEMKAMDEAVRQMHKEFIKMHEEFIKSS